MSCQDIPHHLRALAWWTQRWLEYERRPFTTILPNWITQALEAADREAALAQLRWEGERLERKRAGR